MLDYLLYTAQSFEREHGLDPDVIYINPLHYEQLTRYNPELFAPESKLRLGFRLVIVPANVLALRRGATAGLYLFLPGLACHCGFDRCYWLVGPVALLSACGAGSHRVMKFRSINLEWGDIWLKN